MAEWIIILIISGVLGIAGIICFICARNYIGDPMTSYLAILFFGMGCICLLLSWVSHERDERRVEGAIIVEINGVEYQMVPNPDTVPETLEYNGQTYYIQTEPVQTTEPAVTVVDENTIIVNGNTYLISD